MLTCRFLTINKISLFRNDSKFYFKYKFGTFMSNRLRWSIFQVSVSTLATRTSELPFIVLKEFVSWDAALFGSY